MSEMRNLEDLQEQAEVEKIYREAVDALIVIMLAYGDMPDGRSLIRELMHDFPGSTASFWFGVMEMTADALSDDGLVPGGSGDGGEGA
ncbi:MAG: hypothetical protein OXH19_04140 [Chloroflexi bacterium]|nr:hypothetical protein [Chloroflexota bacterium]MCY3588465.1 hypothetical protein [Chloroflexota bacterium]MCY3686818.1 hypothetical protein [Chloroflexota bacterium]MDE2709390.1 hypothetical protein [Chloroflexota bacterium]